MERLFIKGLKLSELFYGEAVKPILADRFPGLIYSAARLGGGSEVLDYDTLRSTDHHWGPRVQLFISEADHERYSAEIIHALSETLPGEIHGYSTHFAIVNGEEILTPRDSGPLRHGAAVSTLRTFFTDYLGCNPRDGLGITDWLTFPQQHLRTIVSGRVFHDGLGELEPIRETLRYYPHDLWLYLLAGQWRRIDQEEPFMARCGDVGDELGSRLIAARLIRELMKLCFLLERQYAPYSKWFGTAFAKLNCALTFAPIFERALNAQTWPEREKHLSAAYEAAAELHNQLQITSPLPIKVSNFHSRPYRVIHSGRFVEAIRAAITDEAVRRLPPYLGAVDQVVDSTEALADAARMQALKVMYDGE